MKWSFLSLGIIVLGITGVAIILLFQQITTSNERDYYLLKEITEASMIDAIDISYYRETGDLKIITEKCVENFTRRFSESTVLVGSGYTVNFYDIMETPPKVSILIRNSTNDYVLNSEEMDFNVVNRLDAILEYYGEYTDVGPSDEHYNNPYTSKEFTSTYYSIPSLVGNTVGVDTRPINMPDELNRSNIKNVTIKKIEYKGLVTSQAELNIALLRREIDYPDIETNSTDYMLSIDDMVSNLSLMNDNKILFENCSQNGDKLVGSDCTKYDYWIRWSGTTNDTGKKAATIKFDITWSYDEYEYAY